MTRQPGRRLLVLSVAAIAIATLVPTGGGGTASDFCILCGHRGLSDFLSNILLFAPLGFALARRGNTLLFTAAVGTAFTIGIEAAQLSIISGRDANAGDVIANSLGAVSGWFVGATRHWWTRHAGDLRRCLAVTAITLALLIAGLALFRPSLPDNDWYMQWTARFGNMAAYEGQVLSTRIGELDIPGRQRIPNADAVRALLFDAPLHVVATGALPHGIAPIVSIYDEEEREIMMLAAERADLIYRYRMVADDLRLDHGDIRVHQAFEDVADGRTYRLTWTVDDRGYCMELEGRRECGRGFTVGDTWTLLMALDWGTDERAVLRTLWLWLIFLPAGLLATNLRAFAAAAMLTSVVLLGVPYVLGFAWTPLYQLIAALAGLAGGAVLNRQWVMRTSVSAIG